MAATVLTCQFYTRFGSQNEKKKLRMMLLEKERYLRGEKNLVTNGVGAETKEDKLSLLC